MWNYKFPYVSHFIWPSASRRLKRIEGLAAQRQHQAELEDLEALAESARMRIIRYLEARRNGEPLPMLSEPSNRNREPSEARERLRQQLNETHDRLMRFGAIRECMP